jgi:hypothetical protein
LLGAAEVAAETQQHPPSIVIISTSRPVLCNRLGRHHAAAATGAKRRKVESSPVQSAAEAFLHTIPVHTPEKAANDNI